MATMISIEVFDRRSMKCYWSGVKFDWGKKVKLFFQQPLRQK